MTAPTLGWRAPDQGTEDTPEWKVLKADFGDGYTQWSPDGLNYIRRVMRVSWDLQTPAEQATLINFIRAFGVTGFFWTPSDETTPLLWTCTEYTDSRGQGGLRKLSATFRRSFNLDVL